MRLKARFAKQKLCTISRASKHAVIKFDSIELSVVNNNIDETILKMLLTKTILLSLDK